MLTHQRAGERLVTNRLAKPASLQLIHANKTKEQEEKLKSESEREGKFRKQEEIRFCDYVVVVVVFPQRVVGQGPLIARALAHPRIYF